MQLPVECDKVREALEGDVSDQVTVDETSRAKLIKDNLIQREV